MEKPHETDERVSQTDKAFEQAAEQPLDRRKTAILGTVVYEYIATGEPVGSATLTQKYNLGISPATVRAELASLDEEGYLDQPHTSAGRVPSDRGYRYYVDRLMLPETLTAQERERIRLEVNSASHQLDSIVDHASHVLSSLTRNIAFAIAPRLSTQVFRHIELIWLDDHAAHIVLVSNLGLAAQKTVNVQADLDAEALVHAANNFNQHLQGTALRDIDLEALQRLACQTPLPADLLRHIASILAEHSEAGIEGRLFSEGAHNLLDQQEFRDLRKLRAILDLLEEEQTLYQLLHRSLLAEGAKVSIGRELPTADMSECSVVTVPYKVGDSNAGAVGILGPRRMQYARLIALINCMADNLNALFHGDASSTPRE
ncbi:MAG: heat-inducible transcription repressor HrcA [Candidatus Eremiobacter antarcticus]|nr:heat-inducible transcription repressor HrcA [Candidatus Eremiobacteraeota bacterium]MBC5807610.1 heat-inducible transcription repressor HrcA [Candidatus Eremiobacteraeota bacterium]PZR61339.1 MAG: heat-inducible transcription repressor HrcA [Candidatus Eremiobacter sp. RRmetagenome_bin22]